MKWHLLSGGRGLRRQRPGATRENSDEGLDTPEAGTQRSLRDWYVQVQADSRILQKTASDSRTQGRQMGLCDCVRGT